MQSIIRTLIICSMLCILFNAILTQSEELNSYIVTFLKEASDSDIENAKISIGYENITKEFTLIKGFAAKFTKNDIDFGPFHIQGIEPDQDISIESSVTWNLPQILKNTSVATSQTNVVDHNNIAGDGVTIFTLDTGINVNHIEFKSRARLGPSFVDGDSNSEDHNGHGTHLACLAAGSANGIANKASIVSVKVVNDTGTGSTSAIIAGLDWIASNNTCNTSMIVIVMAFSGPNSTAMNDAINKITDLGCLVVVAAGNNGTDSCSYSPSSASNAISVAAKSILPPYWSKCGPCVNVTAPGNAATCAWIGGPTVYAKQSGTSVATARIAGLVANILSIFGRLNCAQVLSKMIQFAISYPLAMCY